MLTQDGSYTLFSKLYNENCHSAEGAWSETLLHYIDGCQVKRQLQEKPSLTILEVGFGLGIGFMATLESLKESDKFWHYLALEIDEDLLEWFRSEQTEHPLLRNLHWLELNGIKILTVTNNQFHLTILAGDARKTLPAYCQHHPIKFDVIYQDAFSPKRNPTLWTQEWFTFLKQNSHSDALLSTYSSSGGCRKAMVAAGWKLEIGPGFGQKKSSTRASLKGETNPAILQQIATDKVSALRDDNP